MRIVTPVQLQRLSDAMHAVTVERLGRNVRGTRLDAVDIDRIAQWFALLVILGGYDGLRFGELAGLRKRGST